MASTSHARASPSTCAASASRHTPCPRHSAVLSTTAQTVSALQLQCLCERGKATQSLTWHSRLQYGVPQLLHLEGASERHRAHFRLVFCSACSASIAAGVQGLVLECHPDPKNAKSDAATMLGLTDVEPLLKACADIAKLRARW